jgi:hypothetical protein
MFAEISVLPNPEIPRFLLPITYIFQVVREKSSRFNFEYVKLHGKSFGYLHIILKTDD